MSSLWMVVIGLWCGAMFVLTGCKPSGSLPGGNVQGDIFLAEPKQVTNLPPLRVSNEVGGGITIITGKDGEIAPDVIATGVGRDLQRAIEEADSHIVLTNTLTSAGQEVIVAATSGANPQDRAHLHVRVPPGINLSAVTIPQGDVGVYGRVGDVTANVAESGNINLLGANGNINLSTRQGSITAELAPGNNKVSAHALKGNIDVIAVDAMVSISTTEQHVRFIGTLRAGQTHYFTTTAAGSIKVALPAYPDGYPTPQIYRFYVNTSASPVNVEYPARRASDETALPICGFIYSSGPYDYHVENTSARTGRIEIEVSPSVTGTYFVTGTLATSYYRFDTNQTRVAFYTPLPQSIHIYTDAQLNQIIAGKETIAPECKAALEADSGNAIVLRMKTDRGPIYIYNMRMLNRIK